MAESTTKPVRVRMAPSPTGPLHVGGARTTLFNWLFARKHGGAFILRIEDTDKERSEKKYETEILEGLAWLGLDWDEGPLADGGRLPVVDEKGEYGPYRQSARTAIYKKYLEQLLEKGDAYYCYCTKEELEAQRQALVAQGLPPKYNGRCRALTSPPPGAKPEVIRFKVPETKVEFHDLVRGKVSFDAALFGDIIIAKDLDNPLYNFAVVVDDALMEISHVIRGEEHLANTPKQILMQRALRFPEPVYAHIPLILNPDRSKMSKRFADTALLQYRERGYLPEAVLNFLALLGWHPKDDREVLSAKDLIKEFDLARVQQAGAIFNEEKLNWLNREHIKKMTGKQLVRAVKPFLERTDFSAGAAIAAGGTAGATRAMGSGTAAANEEFLEKFVAVERTRANTLADFITNGRFFFALPEYEKELLIWKESSQKEAAAALKVIEEAVTKIGAKEFNRETLSAAVTYTITTVDGKRGSVLWPLRVALSGQKASPDPLEIMEVLGKEESLRRIALAREKLAS